MTRQIVFSLDEDSIAQAVQEIEDFKEELIWKCNKLIETLAAEGEYIARWKVASYNAVDTGELLDSITGFFDKGSRVGFIRAGATYAIYVEFGTGIVGASNPHPLGFAYDINNHGEKGWRYYNSDRGYGGWSKGYPARPFMYHTFLELEQKAHEVAANIFT